MAATKNLGKQIAKIPETWDCRDFQVGRQRALRPAPSKPSDRDKWLAARKDLLEAYKEGYGTERDERRYFELLRQLAKLETDTTDLRYELANAYKDGIGTQPDNDSYREWMTQTAEAGDLEAMFALADAYEKDHDYQKYFAWTKMRADAGQPGGMIELAEAYRDGKGIERNDKEFRAWAQKAVDGATSALATAAGQSDFSSDDLPKALYLLAIACRQIDNNEAEYFRYLRDASSASDNAIDAQKQKADLDKVPELLKTFAPIWIALANCYRDAIGTTRDRNKEHDQIQKAVDAKHPEAMLRMAKYHEGDPEESFKWLDQAANVTWPTEEEEFAREYRSAIAEGRYRRGMAYGLGRGVPVSGADFYEEIQGAIRAGHEAAFMAEGLAALLTDNLLNSIDISGILKCFHELRQAVLRVKEEHRLNPKDASEGVAHFTTLDALYNMLPGEPNDGGIGSLNPKNVMYLYNITYVNDPQEGSALMSARDAVKGIGQEFPVDSSDAESAPWHQVHSPLPLAGLPFDVYVGSFTLQADRLDLWRAYGRDGGGFCIVTPVECFGEGEAPDDSSFAALVGREQSGPEVSTKLYRIRYKEDDVKATLKALEPSLNKIKKVIRQICKGKSNQDRDAITKRINLTTRHILSDILYLYKDEEFSREDEVRILAPSAIRSHLVCRDKNRPSRIYVKTRPFLFRPGSRIIIGPKVKDPYAVRLDLSHRIDRDGFRDVKIEFSRIHYR